MRAPVGFYFVCVGLLIGVMSLSVTGEGSRTGDTALLKPFAEYERLSAAWKTTEDETVEQFLNKNEDYYVSRDLRRKWLHRLVKQGKWALFDRYYSDAVRDVELQCTHLNRRLQKGDASEAVVTASRDIWQTARDLPDSCNPLFRALHRDGRLTEADVWERITLAVQAGQDGLARYLEQAYMPAKQRHWVRPWLQARKKTRATLLGPSFPLDGKYSVDIIVDALEQEARRDPPGAESIWRQLVKKKKSLGKHAPQVYAVIGFRAAINQYPDATRWFQDASFEEERVRHWAVRAALREGHWKDVLAFFDNFPEAEQALPEWRYWQARALEETGKKKAARDVYQQIAGERDYYSFLAADKIEATYQMNDRPIETSTDSLAASRAFKIARALAGAGEPMKMRRQWDWALRDLDEEQLKTAAKLAHEWTLYDRAIATAGRAQYYDAVDLRFPILYRDLVQQNAKNHHLPVAYVYGVIRQESAFMADVRSPAGALGLMQIMPGTGRLIARKQKRGHFRTGQLLDPAVNIAMGTYYLRDMLDRFNRNYVMATAAYNAGPLRPPQWQANTPLDADIWIETIPFKETRGYVKSVLSYQAVYRNRLGLSPEPMSRLMPPIPGRGS